MNNKTLKKSVIWLAVASCLGILNSTAYAQEESETLRSDNDENTLEVIQISAERRVSNLQKSALAASVIQGDDLAKLGIMTVDQIQFSTPSATVNNFGQGIDFNIRGIGKAEHNTQTTTGVITYRDGVATFPGYFTAEPYYDIARVEILRGPQGTFVGQNATGGAVFVTSNDPDIDGSHSGYIAGQLGNFKDKSLQGALNLPISDTFAARVAFNAGSRDSFYNIEGPYSGDDGVRMGSARLGLKWEPNADLSVLFKTDYNYLDLSGYPSDPIGSENSPFDITANADIKAVDKFVRSVLKVDYQFSDGTILRSVSGYQKGNTVYKSDLDGTSLGVNTFRDDLDETIYSQEINLISPDTDTFSWILGLYIQNDEYYFKPGEFVIGVPEGNPLTEYSLEGYNPKKTQAIFGQVTYDISTDLELELGARYSKSDTSNDVDVMQYGTPIESVQVAEFSNLTGKLALNWDISNEHFLYAFVASGFRPGGLNVPVGLGLPEPFEAEEIMSYEMGWKAQWLNDHLRTQLTAFRNDYDNFQVTIGYPDYPVFGIELNTPETTKMSGFEAQVQAVFGDFSFDAGVSWLSSKLGTFYATDPRVAALGACNPETGPASESCIGLAGRDQTYAPDFTFNIGLEYEINMWQGLLTPRLNYGHVSEQWATLFQNEALGDRVESRNVLSGQIAWQYDDIVVTLFGTNLTNQHYVGAINSGLRFAGPPKQVGIRLMKTFF
ncbi:TonB-dependent receptor [Alteromonadaceae bacterium BrNp21-10]|nr:TonB-dependent receptor [Alteromonadaceae bacterium BrNp21-10]